MRNPSAAISWIDAMNDAYSSRANVPVTVAAMLSAFVEALPNPAVIVDLELRIVAANESSRRLSPQVQPGTALPLAIRSPDVLDAASRVAKGGRPEKIAWYERVPVQQVYDVHIALIEPDPVRFVLIVLHDVSAALRTERMRSDFIANASHELRTPLASMLGFVETLQGPARNDAEAREKFLSIMREQGRRMARLLDDLLQLSRIEQIQHVRPRGTVDLAQLIRHVTDTLSPVAKEGGVRLAVDAPDELAVTGERDELIRVAENLIENAIKYGADGKQGPAQVDIQLTVEGANAVFSVRDHGPGIASEHLPRLTERFYRVDAPASHAKGGTGLGLAIVKHIIARHRGRLNIYSSPGEGAEFRVTLPLLEHDHFTLKHIRSS